MMMALRDKSFSLFKIIMFFKGYNILKQSKRINNLKNKTFDDYLAWVEFKKWDIVKYHYSNNTFYKNRIGKNLPLDWNELPKITKSDLQVGIDQVLTKTLNKKNIYFSNTSGSSGHPFYFAKDKNAHARTWAYWEKRYFDMGLSLKSKEARFYGIPKELKGFVIEKIKDIILNRKRFPVFDMSDTQLDLYTATFSKVKFDYIYGYTNSILIFAKYLKSKNIILKDICPSLKLTIVTSEVCSLKDKSTIEKYIGVPVKNEYGSSEVGYMAYECDFNVWHVCKENIFIEECENGSLLVTDLFNKAFPIIKYEIGDIAKIENKVCQCGIMDTLITKFDGRENDNILLPSGKISPGLTFYYISRSILESTGFIKEFVIRQTSLDTFVFEIVTEDKINKKIFKVLRSNMDKYLEPGLIVRVNRVDKIKRPKSGKIKHFYCELNN
jgi:phenylacetate-CoA ligase